MRRIAKYMALLSLAPITMSAQTDVSDAIRQINDVKRDTSYLYAEATTATSEEAYDNAKTLLETSIEEWMKKQFGGSDIAGCIAKSRKSMLQIKTRRGSLYRALVYVKKTDLMPYGADKDILVVPVDNQEERNAIDIAEAPSLPQPKSFTPAVRTLSQFESEMLKVKTFDNLTTFIKDKQNAGVISNYGKYATMPTNGKCYLFVYNQQGGIAAYLVMEDSVFINLTTGATDNIKNYKGCGAFWLTLTN